MIKVNKLIHKLREKINICNYKYYVLNKPAITDQQYDLLLLKLEKLERYIPLEKKQKSPTQNINDSLLKHYKQIAHKTPMLSLQNTFNSQFLYKQFICLYKKYINYKNFFCCELKFDGVAINLLYINGHLIHGLTRGNGYIGEDITHNISLIKDIPIKLKGNNIPQTLEVRGEIFITKKNFYYINQNFLMQKKKFCNTRSAVVGLLRMRNINNYANLLSFFCYGVGFANRNIACYHTTLLKQCKTYGLPISSNIISCTTLQEIIQFYDFFKTNRHKLSYDIDGIVIKINDIFLQKQIGCNSRAPKWAIAYKFPSQEKSTILKQIFFQTGRTGIITPIAYFKSIKISGVKICYATLYNINEIYRLDLKIGDIITIQRCGNVIPKIIHVVKSKRTKQHSNKIIIPQFCPSCNAKIINNNNLLYCSASFSCKAQFKEYLKHFISRNAINIKYVGKQLIYRLVEKNIISNVMDLFALNKKQLRLLNLGETTIQKILLSLYAKHKVYLHNFLFALGIKNMGIVTSKNIADHFVTLENFLKTDKYHLLKINGIGLKTISYICSFLKKKDNIQYINLLRQKIDIIYLNITQ
ncbi:NAD-dependent DNA ligase LigA [Enterobacteriaceae endosymbiont of Macroplea mutica]|uniref:NAD-dependent DNA ligase LigA n=1 Tax=Enterobacteriaceae endosymbiont of Macroplea mutica TaxID=2675791 RepID=UPI001448C066|nr:NAD-dependent DNA ligase LigA [Enterobacteriaceae endosymbiont of Macroplea mutica]QJC31079.1 NAD-dependent DNA ligase LigA [Enterobacteriaceae endosymbiont of Macroplea mutica]